MENQNSFQVSSYNRLDEEEADKVEMNFSSREEYLVWVKQWKIALKEKIQDIRNEKAVRRDKTQDSWVRNSANIQRQMLRVECFNLLMIRQAGKKKGIAQRNKALELVAA